MARASKPERPVVAWDRQSLRDPHGQPDKAERVEAMFDAIAPTYELVNAVASLGRDAAWRRRAVAAADVRATDTVLDVCCGTGDMLRAFARGRPVPRLIIGVDFAARMLARAAFPAATTEIQLMRADALRLPLADESVDVVSCAFGVRNFRGLQAGLAEIHRVARCGARVVILEFAAPTSPVLRWLFRAYCERVLPLISAVISREKVGAYRYLASSIRAFETTRTIVRCLTDVGFSDVDAYPMNLGGVVLYRAAKPGVA